MRYKVEYNLFDLLRDLEKRQQRIISDAEVARRLGVHRHTVESMTAGTADEQIRKKMAAVLDFFAAEGMTITIDQLFNVTDTSE